MFIQLIFIGHKFMPIFTIKNHIWTIQPCILLHIFYPLHVEGLTVAYLKTQSQCRLPCFILFYAVYRVSCKSIKVKKTFGKLNEWTFSSGNLQDSRSTFYNLNDLLSFLPLFILYSILSSVRNNHRCVYHVFLDFIAYTST